MKEPEIVFKVIGVVLVFVIFAAIGESLPSLRGLHPQMSPVSNLPSNLPDIDRSSSESYEWETVLNTSFTVFQGNYRYDCFSVVESGDLQPKVKISLETYNNIPVDLFVVDFSDFIKFKMGSSFEYYVYPSMRSTSKGSREWNVPSGVGSFCIIVTPPPYSSGKIVSGRIEVISFPQGALRLVSED